jgi:hypothetical protein
MEKNQPLLHSPERFNAETLDCSGGKKQLRNNNYKVRMMGAHSERAKIMIFRTSMEERRESEYGANSIGLIPQFFQPSIPVS